MSRLTTEPIFFPADARKTWGVRAVDDQELIRFDGATRTVRMGQTSDRIDSSAANESKFRGIYEFNHDGGYGWYTRSYIGTAAISGDAFRAYATVEDVAAATVRAAHISLSMGTSGTVTGLGCALEATLHIPSTAGQTGTIYAVKAAINSDAATSDPVGATTLAYFAAVNQGNATGGADVDTDANLFHIDGHTIGDGNLVEVAADETSYSHNIRIKVGNTTLYLMCADDRD